MLKGRCTERNTHEKGLTFQELKIKLRTNPNPNPNPIEHRPPARKNTSWI